MVFQRWNKVYKRTGPNSGKILLLIEKMHANNQDDTRWTALTADRTVQAVDMRIGGMLSPKKPRGYNYPALPALPAPPTMPASAAAPAALARHGRRARQGHARAAALRRRPAGRGLRALWKQRRRRTRRLRPRRALRLRRLCYKIRSCSCGLPDARRRALFRRGLGLVHRRLEHGDEGPRRLDGRRRAPEPARGARGAVERAGVGPARRRAPLFHPQTRTETSRR